MKTIYLITAIFFSIVIKSQLLKIEYDLIRNTTITTDKDFSEEFKNKVLKSEQNPEKYVLYFANGNSFFKSLPTETVQYENAPVSSGAGSKTLIEIAKKQPVKVYRLKGEKEFYGYTILDGNEFYKKILFKSTSQNYKNDVIEIDKFKCKLVEVIGSTGKIIKVWYTEDLPISTGPFAYGDFPGVVMKVETTTFVIFATSISKEMRENDVERPDPKLKVID